ncbi:hypothetical protein ACOSQ2_021624 [Xanthoceras sorbifolium]
MVVVQGQPVTLTPKTVNEFFELPDIPQVAGGWEEHEFFQAYNYDLASAIRADGLGWNKQECYWRSTKEAKGTSWPPNIQQTGEN